MTNILYGDGVHDDTLAIQEMLDTLDREVKLPLPKVNYLISKTLKIHARQALILPRFAVIRLADDSNCAMLENDDFYHFSEDICVDGGIWDMNNAGQEANPWHFKGKDGKTSFERLKDIGTPFPSSLIVAPPPVFTGMCMHFCRIRNFTLQNITFKNPTTYGADLSFIEYFTVQNITFRYIESQKFWNMDGIHIEGGCKYGYIHNLKGATHDDLVAITADDFIYGEVENICVDGIYAEHSHSAVRLLSHGLKVKNIEIKNVFGSFYTYCIGVTKYHGGEDERGKLENLHFSNIYASACSGTNDVMGGEFNFIWIQNGLDVENLKIENVKREEHVFPTSTVMIDKGASVKGLILKEIVTKNFTGKKMKEINIKGKVEFAKD